MKTFLILFLTLGLLNCQAVISRNGKVQEMIDQLQDNEQFYTEMIEFLDDKMKNDYHNCTAEIKEQNCSDSQIWQQQRSKNSKNITNLQEKISKQNKTIDAILQLNKQEVIKKNLTMAMMFPQVEKLKNDIELIENMLFLVEDTYLNLDNEGKSILLIFDHQFIHPKAQQLQKSFIQLMHRRAQIKEGPPPTEPEQQPENETEEENQEDNQTGNVPLIDEDIFNGEVDQSEAEVSNLFLTTDEDKKQEAELVADDIPDGVNVKEHDQANPDQLQNSESNNQEKQYEDLRIYEVKEDFKSDIKALGKVIHDRLSELLECLNNELDMKTQSVADLEKAIIDLHHKHAKQIVQIYIETKRLQQQIFELDDQVMSLDAQIYDCLNSNKQLQECEDRKGLDQIVLDDLKTEKSFNDAALIELQKLIEFEDRNVYEPEPRIKEQPAVISSEEQQKIEQQAKQQTETENRINQIKSEEALVDQQIQDQEEQQESIKTAHPELQQQAAVVEMPEHLADVPEFKGNVLVRKVGEKEDVISEKEEDKMLQKVDQELGNVGKNLVLLKKSKNKGK